MSVTGYLHNLPPEGGDAEGFKSLATVMALPLVDGVFASLVLAGALSSAAGVFETGVLVFGGTATASIILSEIDAPVSRTVVNVTAIALVLAGVAAVEAMAAPTLRTALDVAAFKYFAAAVLALIAFRIPSRRARQYTPHPTYVLAAGIVVTLQPEGFRLIATPDVLLALKAASAVMVGAVLSVSIAALKPVLGDSINERAVQAGGAIALIVLAFSVVGLTPSSTAIIGPLGAGVIGLLR
ncbi:MAG: DUF5794 domain-containing protein [Halobacteria archaeon]